MSVVNNYREGASSVGNKDEQQLEIQGLMFDGTTAVLKKAIPNIIGKAVIRSEIVEYNMSAACEGSTLAIFFFSPELQDQSLKSLINYYPKLKSHHNSNVVVVTTDSSYSIRQKYLESPQEFPIVSDSTREHCRRYGCLENERNTSLNSFFVVNSQGELAFSMTNDVLEPINFEECVEVVKNCIPK